MKEPLESILQTTAVSNLREHHVWLAMLYRCNDPKSPCWKDYGGRGISVCARWHVFENFYADMGKKPSDAHQLDRYPDNNGNYEPENCRWATVMEQARNRRSNRLVEFNGCVATITEWASRLGTSHQTLRWRLRTGWPLERALKTPVEFYRRRSAINP